MNRILEFVLVSMIASGVHALESPRITVAGGVAVPIGPSPFSDGWNRGGMFALGASKDVSRRVAAGVEIGYHRFRFDDAGFAAAIRESFPSVNVGGNDLDVLAVGARVEIALRAWGTTKPFVLAGAGYDRVTRTAARASGPSAALVRLTDFGANHFALWVGAGARTAISPAASLFVDGSYHFGGGGDAARFVPIRLGVSF